MKQRSFRWWRGVLMVSILLTVGLAAYFWHHYHTPEAYTVRGYALQAAGHYREAVPLFQEVVRQQPGSASAHYDLGLALMGINYRQEKRQVMLGGKPTEVVDEYPPDAAALEAAMQEFTAAVRLEPDMVPAREHLASALHEQGKYDAAILQYQRALQILPMPPAPVDQFPGVQPVGELHLGLASAYLAKKQYGDAIREYRLCLAYEPRRVDVGNSLADLLNTLGRRDEARAEWKQVVTNSIKFQDDFDAKQAQIMLTKYPEQHLPARTGTI